MPVQQFNSADSAVVPDGFCAARGVALDDTWPSELAFDGCDRLTEVDTVDESSSDGGQDLGQQEALRRLYESASLGGDGATRCS